MKTFLRQNLQLIRIGMVSLCLVLMSPLLQATEDDAVARVISASGDVTAMAGEDIRVLARGDGVYVGDIVTTGPNGFAQLRFIDSAIVALKADTAFEISEYVFDQSDDDRATMNLIQGGFRTITGRIGKANRDAYRVVTPYATIGIRGTDYEQVITPTGLMSGVFDGGISLQNDAGMLNLGVGAQFDYAMVTGNSTAPLGLTEQPPELGNTLVIEEEDNQGVENGNEAESEEEGGELPVVPVESVAGQTEVPLDRRDSDDDVAINPNESGDGTVNCNNNSLVCGNEEEPLPDPGPQPEPGPTPALIDTEENSLDRSAVARITYGVVRSRFDGQAGVDAQNNEPGQNTTLLANDSFVLRFGGEAEEHQVNVGGYDVEWGRWRSTPSEPLWQQYREDGDHTHHFDDSVLLFSAVEPVTPTFQGRKSFAATENFLAYSSAENSSVRSIDGQLDIDLATADVKGGIVVTVDSNEGVNFWNGVVGGTLRQQGGTVSGMLIDRSQSFIEPGQDNVGEQTPYKRNFKGDLKGTFTGEGGKGLVLDFDFAESRDAANYVTGLSLFEQKQTEDLELGWGSWDAPVLDNWNEKLVEPTREHLESKSMTSEQVLEMLKDVGGAYAYESAGGFGRSFGGTSGDLSDVQGNFDIDFNTGDIANGQLLVTDARQQIWAVGFDGALNGGDVSLTALPGSFTIDDIANGGNVTLGGAFTDFLASGFTGAFEMIDGNNAGNFVQGVFDLTRGPQLN